jgi:hypothetical protein
LIGLGSDLPGTLWRLLERLERGELELALRRRDLDELAERSRGAAGRLAVAVIAAGFVVGLPVVASPGGRPAGGWSPRSGSPSGPSSRSHCSPACW